MESKWIWNSSLDSWAINRTQRHWKSAPIWDGKQMDLEFIAGFMGYQQDPKTLEICPNLGWKANGFGIHRWIHGLSTGPKDIGNLPQFGMESKWIWNSSLDSWAINRTQR